MKFNTWTLGLTAAIALTSLPAKADPQGTIWPLIPLNMLALSNSTANAGGTNAYWNQQTGAYVSNVDYSFPVPQNAQLIIQPMFAGANASVSNATVSFNLDVAGNGDTNFTTTLPITATVALNGTTNVVGNTIVNYTNVTGEARMRLDQASTSALTNVTFLGLKIGYKNISTASY